MSLRLPESLGGSAFCPFCPVPREDRHSGPLPGTGGPPPSPPRLRFAQGEEGRGREGASMSDKV